MTTYYDVLENPELLKITEDFIARLGGEFAGHVPDGRLFYTPEKGRDSRLSPHEENADTLIQILKDSIAIGENLLEKSWPVLKYETGCVY